MSAKAKVSKIESIVAVIGQGFTVTVEEAVFLKHYTALHIRKLCRDGKLKAKKVSGQWLINKASLDAYEGKKSNSELTKANQQLLKLIAELQEQIAQVKK